MLTEESTKKSTLCPLAVFMNTQINSAKHLGSVLTNVLYSLTARVRHFIVLIVKESRIASSAEVRLTPRLRVGRAWGDLTGIREAVAWGLVRRAGGCRGCGYVKRWTDEFISKLRWQGDVCDTYNKPIWHDHVEILSTMDTVVRHL